MTGHESPPFVPSGFLSLLDGFFQPADGFLQIPSAFLHLAFGLMLETLDLLFRTADQLAGFLLELAADVLCRAFDLILVHVDFLDSPFQLLPDEPGSVRTLVHARSFSVADEQMVMGTGLRLCAPGNIASRALRFAPERTNPPTRFLAHGTDLY
jgi:hypothetical protein